MPRLPGLPHLDLRVEGAYTDLPNLREDNGFFYFNGRYVDGFTNNGNLMGNCGPGNPFGTWQCDSVDDGGFFDNVGLYPSLAVNSAGLGYIAYQDATDGLLKVAYQRFQTFLPLVAR